MSVLIEAVSLVIPRRKLVYEYPGGIEAFVARSTRLSAEQRFICMDEHVLALSYFTPDAAERGTIPLIQAGFTDTREDECIDFAIVDQRYGPVLPCAWLDWAHHPSGHTSAWLAGELPGGLSAPEGWKVDHSLRLRRSDIRSLQDRRLKLADENGVQTWLDFGTGRITVMQ
jgi:hypothetical protein